MTEPRTEAGRSLDAQFGVGQFGRVRDLAVAIESEARNALREELAAAIEHMPTARIISQWDLVSRKAVLALVVSVDDDRTSDQVDDDLDAMAPGNFV